MTVRRLFVLAALAAGPLTFQSAAYTRNATSGGTPLVRTDISSIPVLVNGSMQAGETNAQGAVIITASSNPMQAVAAAAGEWNQVTTAAINFAAPQPTTLTNNPNDRQFVVTIEDNSTNRSIVGQALAVTLFSFNSSGAILDSDIIFNPDVVISGQLTQFSTDHSPGTIDLQSVLVHEMGHSLGANHSQVISATMFQAQPACSQFASVAECTFHQTLSPDDLAFASDAYPSAAAGQLGKISGSVTSAAGLVFGALVVAVNPTTGTTIAGITATDGTYTIRGVPAGNYEVYAQPANGPVQLANLSGLPGITNANNTFRTTFAGGNQSPSTIAVGAGATAQASISVDSSTPGQMQIAILSSGPAGGSGWSFNGGFKALASGGSVDLLLWGPGLTGATESQIQFLGPGVTLRPGSLHTDPTSPVNGNIPIRFTINIAPVPTPTSVTVAIINGTDAAAFSGGIILLGSLPVIDAVKKVQNGASFIQGQAVAPGSFVSIFGINFGSGFTLFNSIPLAPSLAGASVTFNGTPAPMIGVTSGQINAQIPWELPSSGTAQVVVTTAAGSSAPVSIPLTSAAPGLFYIATDNTNVARPGAYNNSDGTLPLPPGVVFPPYKSRPSKPGEILILFATGLGAVTNQPPDGAPGLAQSPFSTTVGTPVVLVGGVPATVTFSGLSPQYPSFYQIAITVPNVPAGPAVPLQIQMNGITTTDQLKIAISN
jgi:uncharacterized protein (TIGR03437 family)